MDRVPVLSTRWIQVAVSATSEVRTSMSRVTAPPKSGAGIPLAALTARCVVSRMRARARSGCMLSAALRPIGSLTTAEWTAGSSSAVSAHATLSPVTSTTGTPKWAATRALIPASPVTVPLRRTSENADGL